MPFILGDFQQKFETKLYENWKNYILCSFLALFAHFHAKKNFSRKSASVTFFIYWYWLLLKISEKKHWTDSEKHWLQTNRQTNWWMPRQACVYRIPSAECLINIVAYAYSNMLIAIYSVGVLTSNCYCLIFSKMKEILHKKSYESIRWFATIWY